MHNHENGGTGQSGSASQSEFPEWFVEARSRAMGRYDSVEHEGCRIAYQAWGRRGLPTLLMLHGAGASSEWWEPTAILLADRFHIVAPSFSGTGRSGWRDSYRIEQSVEEAMACARKEFADPADGNLVVAAHSFGSETGVRLAIDPASRIAHLVLVDSLIGLYGSPASTMPPRQRQFYPSIEDAARRFSTVPRDDFGPPFLRPYVARQSLEAVQMPDGRQAWSWRADPNCLTRMDWAPILDRLGETACPMDFIYGGLSSMNSPELREKQAKAAPEGSIFHELKDAGHHIPLDCPEELAEAIAHLIALRQAEALRPGDPVEASGNV
jgi:pimeloyl-ACP methyl ester carboxylesterase